MFKDEWKEDFERLKVTPDDQAEEVAKEIAEKYVAESAPRSGAEFWKLNEIRLLKSILCMVAKDKAYAGRRSLEEVHALIATPVDSLKTVLEKSDRPRDLDWFIKTDSKLAENVRVSLATRFRGGKPYVG